MTAHFNNPLISIIIVTRNAAAHLAIAIHSLLKQDYRHYELIVIDGASTDNTVDIIRSYQSSISYWQSEPDGGANEAYNIGVRHARGDLIAFLNADDWYEQGILTAVADAYRQHPADVLTCYTRIINDNKQTIAYFNKEKELALTLKNMLFGMPLTNGRFYRRNLFDRVGFLQPTRHDSYCYSADRDWLIRAALQGVSYVIVPQWGYTYLAHAGSITMSGAEHRQEKIFQEHLSLAKDFLSQNLTQKSKRLFEWWYCDQTFRLCHLYFKMKNKKAAWNVFKTMFFAYTGKSCWWGLRLFARRALHWSFRGAGHSEERGTVEIPRSSE